MENIDILKILSKDSIDVDAVSETLHETAIRNFQTLYEIQKSVCGVFRYDIPLSDFKQIIRLPYQKDSFRYPSRYGYSIIKDMLYPDREYAFKSNNLHRASLSQSTLSEHWDIFKYNFIIFIGGYFIPTGEVYISDDEVMVMLDEATSDGDESLQGISPTKMDMFRKNNETVTILIVPNYKSTSAVLNRPTLNMYGGMITNNRFTDYSVLSSESIYMINTTDDYSLYTIIPAIYGENSVTVPSGITIPSVHIRLQGVSLPFINEIRTLDSTDNWFVVSPSDYVMPLPPESILPFIVLDDGSLLFDSNISVKLYYPNIYEVVNIPEGATVKLYIMYNPEKVEAKYRNELEILYRISKDVLELYKTKSLPEMVTNYKPVDFRWFNTNDFVESAYFPDKAIYNIQLLKESAERDPYILVKYLYLRMREKHKYFINMSKLNLSSRVRTDTYQEDQLVNDVIFFDEPHYVISMRKSLLGGDNFGFRMFIDTRFLSPSQYTVMETYDFYHFYIPTRKVTATSIIEMEKYRIFGFSRDVKPTSVDERIEITVPTNIKYIPVYNIQVYMSINKRYIDRSKFKIFVHNDLVDDYIEIDINGNYMIKGNFYIQFTDSSLLSMDLVVSVNHNLVGKVLKSDNTLKQSVQFDNCSNYTHENIRVFYGGIKMLESTYDIGIVGKHGTPISTVFGYPVLNSYVCFIDGLPDKQICEFSLDLIENEYGFVDTGESLTLPLDLKWYDIYVNGMKLNKSNLDIVTATKFFVKGINSRSNLRIYKRNTIHEEFTMLHQEITENKLFDNIDEIYQGLIEDRELISDDMTDISTDIPSDYILKHYLFVANFLEYSFINANEQQVTPEIEEIFPELLDENKILWLDSNTYQDAEVVTIINSNVRSDEMRNDQYRYAWAPLHIGAHDDAKTGEYMCDPLTGSPGMKMEDGSIIATESLYRLNNHRNNFYNHLLSIGSGDLTIYQLDVNGNPVAKYIAFNTNILDSELVIDEPTEKLYMSFDMDVLTRDANNVLVASSYDPVVIIDIEVDGNMYTITVPFHALVYTTCIHTSGSRIVVKSIMLGEDSYSDFDAANIVNILHSILVAF